VWALTGAERLVRIRHDLSKVALEECQILWQKALAGLLAYRSHFSIVIEQRTNGLGGLLRPSVLIVWRLGAPRPFCNWDVRCFIIHAGVFMMRIRKS
jgi:hypothetical protein